ncbi:hypothetical protein [Aquisphaera insulae]|uniref:hypothetical protein n=1 Tax=Aquisphaera insulae TaxID=2712864 RepID=UPI0013EDCDDD|nr:hypothetical protein [Aquisphaera insulae]
MNDVDRESVRKTYQLCRLSYFFLSASLVLASMAAIILTAAILGDRRLILWYRSSPLSEWISTIIVWAMLLGTMLLWGRWEQKSWQRRVGLLLLMCLVDLVLWFMERSAAQGNGAIGWFPDNLGLALGWAEFALVASLTGDYLVHLGAERADESARSIRSLAATGAVVWMLHFCEATNWDGGWPLQARMLGPQGQLLFLGWHLIWTICLIQVSALVLAAFSHSNRVLGEMEKEDRESDPLAHPSESSHRDLLATMPSRGTGPFM